MSDPLLGPAVVAAGVLVVAGLVGLVGRGGRVRLVGPVAAVAEEGQRASLPVTRQSRWIFLGALAVGALVQRLYAGPLEPAPRLGQLTLGEALLLVGGGVMVGLGLRLVEGRLPARGGVGLAPRTAALAALTATGAALATAIVSDLLLR